ncbi:dienelactone hydrolase family protein [Desulfobacterota bacterium AH_259_B03_O07]|nr:dienelactone hydrolase family protein [Desulfobacterota bacterium AH_259_B03_O07]
MRIEGFEEIPFGYSGIEHIVYRKGSGPGVILMHELPGMTKECIRLANRLVEEGYCVYLPLFFGKPGEKRLFGGFIKVCISREFKVFTTGETSPIVEWLKELSRLVWKECGGPGVGVIGMCLTGNFAISLMANKEVLAPVTCQPSLPILPIGQFRKRGLAVSDKDLAEIKKQASEGRKLLGFRFTGDIACPPERFARLKNELGDSFEGIEIDSSEGNEFGIRKRAHSVLTRDFVDKEGHPTEKALKQVLGFLDEMVK